MLVCTLHFAFAYINTALEIHLEQNLPQQHIQTATKPLFLTRNQILNQPNAQTAENHLIPQPIDNPCSSVPISVTRHRSIHISKINLLPDKEMHFKQEGPQIFIYDQQGCLFAQIPLLEPNPEQINGTKPYTIIISRDVLYKKAFITTANYDYDFPIEIYFLFLEASTDLEEKEIPNTYHITLVQSLTSKFLENYLVLLKSGFGDFFNRAINEIEQTIPTQCILNYYAQIKSLCDDIYRFHRIIKALRRNLGILPKSLLKLNFSIISDIVKTPYIVSQSKNIVFIFIILAPLTVVVS